MHRTPRLGIGSPSRSGLVASSSKTFQVFKPPTFQLSAAEVLTVQKRSLTDETLLRARHRSSLVARRRIARAGGRCAARQKEAGQAGRRQNRPAVLASDD